MRTVEAGASARELVGCISEWSDLLAAGDFAAGVDFLHSPSEDSGVERWTAESLKTYIENYGSWDELADGSRMRVTPIDRLTEADGHERHYVYRFEDRPPNVEFTLPLDGEWSDLTAIFDVVELDGRWAFVLYDLRVL